MRNRNVTFFLVAVVLFTALGSCSQDRSCKPGTIFTRLRCPMESFDGHFEISIKRGDSTPASLENVTAVCPETSLALQLAEYQRGESIDLVAVAVEKDGNRRGLQGLTFELDEGCSAVALDDRTDATQLDANTSGSDASLKTDGGTGTDDSGVAICVSGDLRCSGSTVQVCDASQWADKETCPNECSAGRCGGECVSGAKTCQGNRVATCKDGKITLGDECPFVCDQGACTGECKPTSRQCTTGNVPQLCDANGAWQASQACSVSCTNGLCDGCKKDQVACDGLTPLICDANGKWVKQPGCMFVCKAEAGCSGTCKPKDRQCSSNGTPQECDADGNWKNVGAACPFICRDGSCAGECRPNDKTCASGQVPQTCSSTGVWTSANACPYVCKDGTCSGSCRPDTVSCNAAGTSVQLCNSVGSWTDISTCSNGCQANTCNECTPGTSSCTGAGDSDRQVCGSNGKWGVATNCPNKCTAGACNECASGTTMCNGSGDLVSCVAGKWSAPQSCGGKGCMSNRCNSCVPNQARCTLDGRAALCSADGSSETFRVCSAPTGGTAACQGGKCRYEVAIGASTPTGTSTLTSSTPSWNASDLWAGSTYVPPGGFYVEWYALFSFDLSSIPSTASIVSARLQVVALNFEGTPFADGNSLLLKHVVHPEPPSFRNFLTRQTVTKLTSQATDLTHDVTTWVAVDLQNRGEQSNRSQFVYEMSMRRSDRILINFDRGSAGLYLVYEQ